LNVFTAEPCLIQTLQLGKWIVHRCLNCDEFVYAFSSAGEYLLNGNLVRDEKKLQQLESCDKYSLAFKIILRQVDNFGSENVIGNDARIKQLHMKLQDYIANETITIEREIQQFTERKLAELNYKRECAAKEYALLANIIRSLANQQIVIDCKNSTNLDSLNIQTNGTISADTIADTPPVTPPIGMDISPSNIPQQNSINKKIKEKHSTTINQQLGQITKTFDFDEIFDMDGMVSHPLTNTNNTSDGPRPVTTPTTTTPHKGQSVKFADAEYQSDDGELSITPTLISIILFHYH
jgi:hypothetical protein